MNLEQAYYELKFEIAFRDTKGSAFQDFFNRLMGLAYKADFMACRPWGREGDRKNDGFLKSKRRLFQVYAPNEMTKSKAIKKITEDFQGAKAYWGEHFDTWVFVHNATDGLPPHVQKYLLDFEKENTAIVLEPWGLEELRSVFRRLSPEDLESWFGPAPTKETKLGFEDLRIVLARISAKNAPPDQSIRDVPMGKIEANALSESVAILLKDGMTKAPLVEAFFAKGRNADFGERIAESFREQYKSLGEKPTPDEIFSELQGWVGGQDRGTPEHELAVLAVLAYYFERCDIFTIKQQPRFRAVGWISEAHPPSPLCIRDSDVRMRRWFIYSCWILRILS
uniref:ABC-three component systems C-terminal domain-containing protein n=1 Tax=Candidatus Kentrum sp. LPFa TaxID=2126335 RepID=A0A450WQJ0_9GAMM|nr:MAG: hypothetical protein BECKLPF1236B_GA0070989_11667 [Candidatus Kentron sp. LPFa]